MRGIYILLKKELSETFSSPLIYILTALLSALMGWLFYNYLIAASHLTELSLSDSVLKPLFGNMNFIFLFLAPLVTMKMFAGEKRQHTLELLFLSHLNDYQIILGKFLTATLSIVFMLSFTLIFPLILAFSGFQDWGFIFSAYMGIILSVMCYIAVGLFTSSLTNNQILAAISAFCLLMTSLLLVITSNAINNFIVAQIFEYMSIPFHFDSFVQGSVTSYNVVFFFTFFVFFIFMTAKSLNSRRW